MPTEKAKLKLSIMRKKARIYGLDEEFKEKKAELQRLRQLIQELTEEAQIKQHSTGCTENAGMTRLIAELEQELAQVKRDKALLTAATSNNSDAQQQTIAEIKDAHTRKEMESLDQINALEGQLTTVTLSQVKLQAQCETLTRQKRDAEQLCQALDARCKAGCDGLVSVVAQSYASTGVTAGSAVGGVDAAVAAALSAAQKEFAAQMADKDALIQKLVLDTKSAKTAHMMEMEAREGAERNRTQDERQLSIRAERVSELEGDCRELREAVAALEVTLQERDVTIESLRAVVDSFKVATSLIAELEQTLAANAEAFAAMTKEIKELQARQSKRAGLVSLAVAKLRVLFPAQIDALARSPATQKLNLLPEALDHYLLGVFGQERTVPVDPYRATQARSASSEASMAGNGVPKTVTQASSGPGQFHESGVALSGKLTDDVRTPAGTGKGAAPAALPNRSFTPSVPLFATPVAEPRSGPVGAPSAVASAPSRGTEISHSASALGKRARSNESQDRDHAGAEEYHTVRISNLPPHTPTQQVRDLALRYGNVASCEMLPSQTSYSVTYILSAAAALAVERLPLFSHYGYKLSCQPYCKPGGGPRSSAGSSAAAGTSAQDARAAEALQDRRNPPPLSTARKEAPVARRSAERSYASPSRSRSPSPDRTGAAFPTQTVEVRLPAAFPKYSSSREVSSGKFCTVCEGQGRHPEACRTHDTAEHRFGKDSASVQAIVQPVRAI
jgi:hypothetical protein